jgi:hypothetical protein
MPSQWYHNKLMQEIDEAYWIGNEDEANVLELKADDVKQYIKEGKTWYPQF